MRVATGRTWRTGSRAPSPMRAPRCRRDQPGGVFVLRSAHDPGGRPHVAPRRGARGPRCVRDATSPDELAQLAEEPARLPPLVPTLPDTAVPEPLDRPEGLLFDNGLGGFTPDGREYVVHLVPTSDTPAPWVNVIANPRFGFVVSESGAGSHVGREQRRESAHAVAQRPGADEPGEALYLRDEETGAVWSPTPRPVPGPGSYQVGTARATPPSITGAGDSISTCACASRRTIPSRSSSSG